MDNPHPTHAGILAALKRARATIVAYDEHGDDAVVTELDKLIEGLTRPNPDEKGFYWWLIAVGVDKRWVADGIDFTDRKAHDLLCQQFLYCRSRELKAIVLGRPDDDSTAKAQGYESTEAYLKARGGH